MKKFFYGMMTMYFLGRITGWWGRVFTSVFGTPAVKASLADATASAMEKAVFGDRPVSNRVYSTNVRYDKMPRPQTRHDDRLQKRIDEFRSNVAMFESSYQACTALNALRTLIERYDAASVSDFYELAGLHAFDIVNDNRIGWKSLTSEVKTYRVRGGYVIGLPKPVKL